MAASLYTTTARCCFTGACWQQAGSTCWQPAPCFLVCGHCCGQGAPEAKEAAGVPKGQAFAREGRGQRVNESKRGLKGLQNEKERAHEALTRAGKARGWASRAGRRGGGCGKTVQSRAGQDMLGVNMINTYSKCKARAGEGVMTHRLSLPPRALSQRLPFSGGSNCEWRQVQDTCEIQAAIPPPSPRRPCSQCSPALPGSNKRSLEKEAGPGGRRKCGPKGRTNSCRLWPRRRGLAERGTQRGIQRGIQGNPGVSGGIRAAPARQLRVLVLPLLPWFLARGRGRAPQVRGHVLVLPGERSIRQRPLHYMTRFGQKEHQAKCITVHDKL